MGESPLRIVVGSTNAAKLRAVENACKQLFAKHGGGINVVGVSVPSGVRDQPLSDEETVQGARARAAAALATHPECDYGVGIEGGTHKIGDRWFEAGWVAVMDQSGRVGLGSSGRYELSVKIMQRLLAGEELADVVDDLTGMKDVRSSQGAMVSISAQVAMSSNAEALLNAVIHRLEAATQRLEALTKTGSHAAAPADAAPAAAGGPASPALAAFDDFVSTSFKPFATLSATVGGLVKEQVDILATAFANERRLIELASQAKKPDQPTLAELIKPLQTAISKVIEIKDKNRPSPLFAHLSAVADGVGALGWVVVEPTPAPYINELKDSAQFYANRVIKENKDKDKFHADWSNAYMTMLTDLSAYVKKWHTTGLAWNPRGGDAKMLAASAPAASQPAPVAGAPPPPPPLPTAAQLEAFGGGSSGDAAKKGGNPAAALLGEISKGNVTSGLRKVDKSEMTHKNPELRAGSVVKAGTTEAPKAATPSYAGKSAPVGPPKLALDGNKWVVENQIGQSSVVIEDTQIKQVVYIYNCQNSTIQIKGKVNAVTVDNCKKVGILIENTVSTVDVVNAKSVQMQITGKAPTVVVDKTDGFQLYLSKEGLDTEIMTAKSSEMNVLLPTDDGDYTETPLPEQLKTVLRNGKLVTEVVEHKG